MRLSRVHAPLIVFALIASSASAMAESIRLRGKIEKIDGNVLTVQSRDGTSVILKLSDTYAVSATRKASLEDIKPNTFVGTAAVPQADGTLRALEVHIFTEAQRGTGEGFRDYDLAPKSTMTNAAVTGSVASADGRVLTLTYKGGEKKVVVPPNCPIVLNEPATKDDVKVGVGIVVQAADKQADGTYTTARLTVGKNGVNPPM